MSLIDDLNINLKNTMLHVNLIINNFKITLELHFFSNYMITHLLKNLRSYFEKYLKEIFEKIIPIILLLENQLSQSNGDSNRIIKFFIMILISYNLSIDIIIYFQFILILCIFLINFLLLNHQSTF